MRLDGIMSRLLSHASSRRLFLTYPLSPDVETFNPIKQAIVSEESYGKRGRMVFSRHARLLIMLLLGIVPFTGLVVVSIAAPDAQKKPAAFPLNLFKEAKPDDYIDEGNCVECHKEAHASWVNSPHALFLNDPSRPVDRRGCQSCHGPGGPHVSHLKDEDEPYKYIISYTKTKPAESAAACLRCHDDTMTQAHWRRTGHARAGVTCTGCHQLHWPDRLGKEYEKPADSEDKDKSTGKVTGSSKTLQSPVYTAAPDPKSLLKASEAALCGQCHKKQTAEFRNNFHHPIPEGRMVCSDCHTVHPTRNTEGHVRTNKQNCVRCHADVAGPFVFEHEPVSDLAGEGCMECHRPHGSHNPKLLSTFSRGQCNQCHSDKGNNHFPGRTCWQSGCHEAVHGSNHDRTLFRR
jgi:predicted CXXCH cytochrome family protein